MSQPDFVPCIPSPAGLCWQGLCVQKNHQALHWTAVFVVGGPVIYRTGQGMERGSGSKGRGWVVGSLQCTQRCEACIGSIQPAVLQQAAVATGLPWLASVLATPSLGSFWLCGAVPPSESAGRCRLLLLPRHTHTARTRGVTAGTALACAGCCIVGAACAHDDEACCALWRVGATS